MIIAIVIGLLALFSLISILLGTEEPRQAKSIHEHDARFSGCGSALAERRPSIDSLTPTRPRTRGASFDSRPSLPAPRADRRAGTGETSRPGRAPRGR